MAQDRASTGGSTSQGPGVLGYVSAGQPNNMPNFVRYICGLPDRPGNAETGSEERPRKRARVHCETHPVTIAQYEFSIGKYKEYDGMENYMARRDVGAHLSLHVVAPKTGDSETGSFSLNISATSGLLFGNFPLPTPMPQNLAAILQLAEKQAYDPEIDGALWVELDIELRKVQDEPYVHVICKVIWNESNSNNPKSLPHHLQKARDAYLQFMSKEWITLSPANNRPWGPQDFYEAAFIPGKASLDAKLASMEIPDLTTSLYPFQKRAVQWLLEREGATWSEGSEQHGPGVHKLDTSERSFLPLSFWDTPDTNNEAVYLSYELDVITRDLNPYYGMQHSLKGGILAEEMGLGKTLEIVALVSLHRRPQGPGVVNDLFSGAENIRTTSATLIVTPGLLLDQWLSEFKRHSPNLKVTSYKGLAKAANRGQGEERMVQDTIQLFTESDIVVTTYEVLSRDFPYAVDPPDRQLRRERKYKAPKSPLVQVSWWRVCIDEAQMVESGVSAAARLARMIPRVNAWSVTGTPVKDDVRKDLRGLLIFLRYEPFASSKKAWDRLTSGNKELFQTLFRTISLRHTKSLVRDEIIVPPQKRYVITMPFTPVEEQHYQDLFRTLVMTFGLDTEGNPVEEDWQPDNPWTLAAMRTALDRLRQTALHPEVGLRNRRALGQNRNGPLRTVAEVLDAILEQSEITIRAEQRTLLSTRLTRGQLLEESPRVREALVIWQDVCQENGSIVAECRKGLEQAKEQAEAANQANPKTQSLDVDDPEESLEARVGEARRRLRSALEVQHRAVFFSANGYHQIKTNKDMTAPDSERFKNLERLETEAYAEAKAIRKEILQESLQKASSLMRQIADSASKQSFAVIPELAPVAGTGIESRRIIDGLEELYTFLNRQADQLDEWREHVIQLLLKALIDEDDDAEATGEEYEESTKLQEEIIVYVQFLRAMVHDRQDALSGQKNNLVAHEVMGAMRQATDGEGPAPQKVLELFNIRSSLNETNPAASPRGSLKGVIADLRALSGKLRSDGNHRAAVEMNIVADQLELATSEFSKQNKIASQMEQEVDRFADAMNARVEFYRQLQAVSDTVAKYEGPKDEAAMASFKNQEEESRQKLERAKSRHRYLLHLKDAGSGSELCVICQATFSIGVLTVCGHQFCKECITLWFKAHHNCPVCKRQLQTSSLHDITLKPQELKVQSEGSTSASYDEARHDRKSKKSTIYSEFNPEKLAEIKNIDLDGPSFTTKVDTLVRHILWLRESDPGAKSIVFSQYQEFLDVLRQAFQRYRIGFTSFSDPNGITKFKEDPAYEVFFLHARAQASGLNLVNASHVFLCEPLLNTALELQAIARVDRIGQQNDTTVWLYIVDGTVEESIYNLSVQRRMEHMGRNLEGKSKESTPELADANLEAANSMELQQTTLKMSKLMGRRRTAGEVVGKKDLWQCLFGHVARGRDRDQQRDEQLRNNPVVRGYLAAEAAEARGGERS